MNIQILSTKQLENGTYELIIDMDDETKHYLINYAIISLIKNGLDEVVNMYKETENED